MLVRRSVDAAAEIAMSARIAMSAQIRTAPHPRRHLWRSHRVTHAVVERGLVGETAGSCRALVGGKVKDSVQGEYRNGDEREGTERNGGERRGMGGLGEKERKGTGDSEWVLKVTREERAKAMGSKQEVNNFVDGLS